MRVSNVSTLMLFSYGNFVFTCQPCTKPAVKIKTEPNACIQSFSTDYTRMPS